MVYEIGPWEGGVGLKVEFVPRMDNLQKKGGLGRIFFFIMRSR